MRYKLCARLLHSESSEDVREIVNAYITAMADCEESRRIIEAQREEIKILTAENNLLKLNPE